MAASQPMIFAVDREPSLAERRALREAAGLTLEQMAELAHKAGRQWWYRIETGRTIDLAVWELLLLKLGRHPTFALRKSL